VCVNEKNGGFSCYSNGVEEKTGEEDEGKCLNDQSRISTRFSSKVKFIVASDFIATKDRTLG
jgi:hypothetical protein